MAILGIQEGSGDAASFPRVVLLPNEWLEFVTPALQFWSANELDLERLTQAPRPSFLLDVLKHENPLLRVMALRALIDANGGDEERQGFAFAHRGVEQAVATFLLLSHHDRIEFVQDFQAILVTAESLERFRGTVLGAFTALRFGETPEVREAGRHILESTKTWLTQLHPDYVSEKYVSDILNAARVSGN